MKKFVLAPFLAALASGLMGGSASDPACLARACRIGEWVASRHGATPDYDPPPAR